MKTVLSLLAAGTAALLAMAPADAALPVGARAPTFRTPSATGGRVAGFDLREALRRGPVVLYFFPAAFTSGCTVEAHEFAAAAARFSAEGAALIGLSADPIDRLQRFSVEECRNAFPVGVASPAIVSGYDVPLGGGRPLTNRTSYVIAPDGTVIYVHSDLNPAGHVAGTLHAVQAWRQTHPRR